MPSSAPGTVPVSAGRPPTVTGAGAASDTSDTVTVPRMNEWKLQW